ncbi:MAG: hypothetical protein HC892_14630 [Saprospiraceae bacterium]|nr:hypothetical protein [Saprospiraceae bacterium]
MFLLLAVQCSEPVFTPKPRAYPRIEYPERAYQAFDTSFCAFTFQYPKYATIIKSTNPNAANGECWFDIFIPNFDCRLHCTYYPIANNSDFEQLRSDAFNLVDNHNIRADYINESRIQKDNQVSGFLFDIEGPAASPFQFYLTDSTKHFLRASLYFNTQAKHDSLAPIYEFVKTDFLHLISTFAWKQ